MTGASLGWVRWKAVAFVVLSLVVMGAQEIFGLPSASAVGNMPTGAKIYGATVASNSAVIVATIGMTYGSKGSLSVTTMGPFSWSKNRGEFTVSVVGSGSAITTQEIIDGHETFSTTSTVGLLANAVGSGGWTETTWRGHAAGGGIQELLDFSIFGLVGSPPGGTSPQTILGLLRSRQTSEEMVGNSVLDGVETSHFRSSIPFSRLGVSAADAAQIGRVLGTKFLHVDYWTDSSERLRLMRFGLKMEHYPEATTTTTTTRSGGLSSTTLLPLPITVTVSLQLSDYGTLVNVTPPLPSDITSRTSCVVSDSGSSC